MIPDIDAFCRHMVEERRIPFLDQSPHHVIEVFLRSAAAVHVDGSFSGPEFIREHRVPDIARNVAQLPGCLFDKRTHLFAMGVFVKSDPCGFAASGKIFGPCMPMGELHVRQLRA
jgi:hypothetical protein